MKVKSIRILTALCAALLFMGGFSMPAYAQGVEQPPADATNDSNVQVEQPEEAPPLTPEGNVTLVDDYGGNKQLITVTTKSGNYFYILVDRDDEGENTVHFLNQVDEADLMALMEDEGGEETPAVCSCTVKCQAGAIDRNCPVCSFTMASCTGKADEPEEEPAVQEAEPEKKSGVNLAVLLLVLALFGGGGAFYYMKFIKNKPKAKGAKNLDDYEDYGEEEDPEDEAWESEEAVEEPEESEDILE